MSGANRHAAMFVLVTVFLDVVSVGLVIPVIPKFALVLAGGTVADAASMIGWSVTVWEATQLVSSPVLGSLSDRIGRRPVILLSNVALGFQYLLLPSLTTLPWLLAGRAAAGMCSASIPVVQAYIADVTPESERAKSYGLVGAVFGCAFIVGPAIGGILGHSDYRIPFWVAGGMSLANAVYGTFVLPESLPREKREGLPPRSMNPFRALSILFVNRARIAITASRFANDLANFALQSVYFAYVAYRYSWQSRQIGLAVMTVGIAVALAQAFLVRPFLRSLGERRTLAVAFGVGMAGFCVYGLAPSTPLFLLGVPLLAIWTLVGPVMQGIATRSAGSGEQGQLQGALNSVTSTSGVVGPFALTQAFTWGVAIGVPGLPFFVSSGLVAIALVAALIASRRVPAHAPG